METDTRFNQETTQMLKGRFRTKVARFPTVEGFDQQTAPTLSTVEEAPAGEHAETARASERARLFERRGKERASQQAS